MCGKMAMVKRSGRKIYVPFGCTVGEESLLVSKFWHRTETVYAVRDSYLLEMSLEKFKELQKACSKDESYKEFEYMIQRNYSFKKLSFDSLV
jgi:hypothetical protein